MATATAKLPCVVCGAADGPDISGPLMRLGLTVTLCSAPPPNGTDAAAPVEAAEAVVAEARRHCAAAREPRDRPEPAGLAVGVAHQICPVPSEADRFTVRCAVAAANLQTGDHFEVRREAPSGPNPDQQADILTALVTEAAKEAVRNVREGMPEVPSWRSLDLSTSHHPAEPPSPRHGLAEVLEDATGSGVPPEVLASVVAPHETRLNCNVLECMRCGVPIGVPMRRIWCPKCNTTICPDCCSSPIMHLARARPCSTCRTCAKLGCTPRVVESAPRRLPVSTSLDLDGDAFRLMSSHQVFSSKDDEELPDDEACEGCSVPFSFFRTRRQCAQCGRVRCAKCLVQKPHSSDNTRLCGECLYGPDFNRRRVGIDPQVPNCLVCDSQFSLFRRRHWCRRCGRTICSGCSATPISGWLRRHPKCICKRCFVPKIFRLPYDLAQYMMEFLNQEARTACNRVCKRFQRLLVLPFNAINRLEDYYVVDTKKDLLGEGAFGMVYSAQCRRTGESRAIKVISKKKLATYEKVRILEREISIHSQLDHPNTVPLYEVMQTNTEVFMVMGRAGKYDLVDYLLSKRRLPEHQVIHIAVQVLQFLHYLHSEKFIVHRDLKLDNIMMSPEENGMLVRVIDFGLAKIIGPPPEVDRTDPVNFMRGTSTYGEGIPMGSTAPRSWSPLPGASPPTRDVPVSNSPLGSSIQGLSGTNIQQLMSQSRSSVPSGSPLQGPRARSKSPRRDSGSSTGRRSDAGVLCTPCGTLRYCAPEVLAVRSQHQKVPHVAVFKRDIFSLGVLLYALLCGRLPYESSSVRQLRREMARPLSFAGGEGLSADCKAFIAALCTLKPYYRPSAASALTHSWLLGSGRLSTIHLAPTICPEYRRRRQLERECGLQHDRPFMHMRVEEDETGSVVAEQMQLSGYFNPTAETMTGSEMGYQW